jgi:hypothetical protein
MPRKTRPLDRDSGVVRDASLVIIASEDTYAVKQYFARFKTKKVQFLVLPSTDGRSSPEHVLDRLRNAVNDNATELGDSFWLCIDRDRWDHASLSHVVSQCHAKNFRVAMSSPCFELWLLLHFQEVSEQLGTCQEVMAKLRSLHGGYSKQCCRSVGITEEMVREAISRAKHLDHSDNPLLETTSTHVYKILELLIEKDAIRF